MSESANVTKVIERENGKKARNNVLIIDEDITFTAKSGNKYTIHGADVFKYGGEATLYFCSEDEEPNSKKLFAKIYDNATYTGTYDEYLNYRESVAEFVKENSSQEKHLLPIFDYGLMEYEVGNGKISVYFVEVIPYCQDGDLSQKKLDYKELRYKLIPEINEALNCLHSAKYVHRDVKPDNMFIYNDSYVLGDFGSITLENINDMHLTQTLKITIGYTPMEALAMTFFSSTDYYAFGMSIATLYAGKYIFKGLNDESAALNALEVQKAVDNRKLPIGFNKEEKNIGDLILGLLHYMYKERLTYEDVVKWVETGEVRTTITNYPPFKTLKGVCNTPEELCIYLNEYWEEAIEYVKNENLKLYVIKYNDGLSTIINSINKKNKNKSISDDAAVSQSLYCISPDALRYKNNEFSLMSSFVEFIANNNENSMQITEEMLKNKLISWWIAKKTENEADEKIKSLYTSLLPQVENIETIAEKFPTFAYGLFVNVIEERDDKTNSNIMSKVYHGSTPDEVFSYFQSKLDYYAMSSVFMKNAELMLAFLDSCTSRIECKIGSEVFNFDNITDFINKIESINDYQKVYTIISFLFEEACAAKESVREFYVQKGPFACYIWLKDHADIYSEKNGRLLETLKSASFDYTKSLAELYNQLLTLENNVYKIRREIQKQIMHFKNQTSYITLTSPDGKFIDNKFGKHITQGFYNYMTGRVSE